MPRRSVNDREGRKTQQEIQIPLQYGGTFIFIFNSSEQTAVVVDINSSEFMHQKGMYIDKDWKIYDGVTYRKAVEFDRKTSKVTKHYIHNGYIHDGFFENGYYIIEYRFSSKKTWLMMIEKQEREREREARARYAVVVKAQ